MIKGIRYSSDVEVVRNSIKFEYAYIVGRIDAFHKVQTHPNLLLAYAKCCKAPFNLLATNPQNGRLSCFGLFVQRAKCFDSFVLLYFYVRSAIFLTKCFVSICILLDKTSF